MDKNILNTIQNDINKYYKEMEGMQKYLLLKFDQRDWHGVADAAMDIREIKAKIDILENQLILL